MSNRETESAVIFLGGVVGVMTLTVLMILGRLPPTNVLVPMIGLYAAMLGLYPAAILDRRRSDRDNGARDDGNRVTNGRDV